MEYIIIGFFLALAKTILLFRIFPARLIIRYSVWIDAFLTIILPIFAEMLGSVQALMLMLMSGLWVSFFLFIARAFIRKEAR